ncbi:MAG: hypothetical protein II839_10040 [Kiritimatiellae bacterium]|nr:hypothetical protein [Kiritimatiellia bacterium]
MTNIRSLFFLSAAAALQVCAQEPAPSAPASAPAAPVRRGLPPEAFTTPTNFVYLVDLSGEVRAGRGTDGAWLPENWLEDQAAAMQRSLQVGVKTAHGPFEDRDGASSEPFVSSPHLSLSWPDGDAGGGDDPRFVARRLFKLFPDAKILVILAEGENLPPVLASPYENWVVMDAGWVKRGGGDAALLADRMGKRVYQALGACCGAAYHPEREAVMRYSPTPEALDECLSHNFHPLNSNAFSIVARAVGLDPVRLRPRKELLEMGILKPRVPAAAVTNAPPAAENAGSAENGKND